MVLLDCFGDLCDRLLKYCYDVAHFLPLAFLRRAASTRNLTAMMLMMIRCRARRLIARLRGMCTFIPLPLIPLL